MKNAAAIIFLALASLITTYHNVIQDNEMRKLRKEINWQLDFDNNLLKHIQRQDSIIHILVVKNYPNK